MKQTIGPRELELRALRERRLLTIAIDKAQRELTPDEIKARATYALERAATRQNMTLAELMTEAKRVAPKKPVKKAKLKKAKRGKHGRKKPHDAR